MRQRNESFIVITVTIAEPFVNNALIFETGLDLPTMELPELNQIDGLECPTDVNNGAFAH
jgi:hypothetical protein